MKIAKIVVVIASAALAPVGFGGVHDHYYLAVWAYAATLVLLLWVAGPKWDRLITHLIWILVCASLLLPVWRWGRLQEWRADTSEQVKSR